MNKFTIKLIPKNLNEAVSYSKRKTGTVITNIYNDGKLATKIVQPGNNNTISKSTQQFTTAYHNENPEVYCQLFKPINDNGLSGLANYNKLLIGGWRKTKA